MRDIGLPAALVLPSIEHRMSILQEQSDVAELQANITGDSSEEMLHMYVLPDNSNLDRLLTTIDALTTELRRQKNLSALSPVQVGSSVPVTIKIGDSSRSFEKTPVSFEADVNEQGLKTLFLFQNLSGLLSVSDALTDAQQTELLHLTEQENPAAVTALESFLSTDLLSYAGAPQLTEEQLFKSFSSDAFIQSFHGITQASALGDVVQLLSGPLGQTLQTQKLWPLRFLMPVKSAIRETGEGRYHVAVTWEAYSR